MCVCVCVCWTLWGHSRDTPGDTVGHSLGHLCFRGHSCGHSGPLGLRGLVGGIAIQGRFYDNSWPNVAISLGPYRCLSGPSGPEIPKKSEKKKVTGMKKKVEKMVETWLFLTRFWPFFDYFSTFLGLFFLNFSDPGYLFSDFFLISGPKGPNDSCKGPRRSQAKCATVRELGAGQRQLDLQDVFQCVCTSLWFIKPKRLGRHACRTKLSPKNF